MKTKILIVISIIVCLCFSACSGQKLPSVGNNESCISNFSTKNHENLQVESGEKENQDQSQVVTESEANIFQYDNLPSFSIPNSDIVPEKIVYNKVMLGETTEIVDAERINQIIELLQEVKIKNTPSEKDDNPEIHQIISFYQNINDEIPSYSLYFLIDSLFIETNGIRSDIYPTPNWVNAGSDDESKINVRFRKLVDSWADPSFPS